jgi:hypothetical protein
MSIQIVAVIADTWQKLLGMTDVSPANAANPPTTVESMEAVLKFVPKIRALGPYANMYSSRFAYVSDIASVIALALNMDFSTLSGLSKYINLDCETNRCYPGHEKDDVLKWQFDGVSAFREIHHKHRSGEVILVVSHRPIIGGVMAHCYNVHDPAKIMTIVNHPKTVKGGFRVFEVNENDTMRVLK